MKLKDLKRMNLSDRFLYKDCLFFISVSGGKENKNKELYYIFEYILMLLITY